MVCGTATSGEEARERLGAVEADVVLVDVSLPGMSGIDLVAELQSSRPDLVCLMLSGHGEVTYVRRSLEAGAKG